MKRISTPYASIAAVVVSLALASSASAGQLVVIKSDVNQLKPGMILDDANPLEIAEGKTVKLISESGKIHLVKGPFNGKVGSNLESGEKKSGKLITALSQIVTGGGKGNLALGAMRAALPPGTPPMPWMINAERAGHQCYQGEKAVLWRMDSTSERSLSIKNKSDKSNAKASWPKDHDILPWPSSATLSDGSVYLLRFKGETTAKKVTLHRAPDGISDNADLAIWMDDQGCSAQALTLLQTME